MQIFCQTILSECCLYCFFFPSDATTHSSPLSLHPVLPPIAQAPSPASGPPSTPPAHSHPPTPTYGTPPHRPSDPPSYEQASLEASPRQPTTSGGSPSDYYQEPRAASREGRGEGVDMTQYVSSEEIHIASMEGVKAAVMRRLVGGASTYHQAASIHIFCSLIGHAVWC